MPLPTCYTRYNGIIAPARSGVVPYGTTPPPGHFQPCCFFTDRCLLGSQTGMPICQFPGIHNNTSGYYAAGCTDPNWIDASCPKHCDGAYNYLSDITYIPGSSLWGCCQTFANKTTNCLTHTEDTWTDVMPQDLQLYVTPPASTSSKSHRLALGLGIGLGLGLGLLIVSALTLILWKYRRRRRNNRRIDSSTSASKPTSVSNGDGPEMATPETTHEKPGNVGELAADVLRHEIDLSRSRYELPGSKTVNGWQYH